MYKFRTHALQIIRLSPHLGMTLESHSAKPVPEYLVIGFEDVRTRPSAGLARPSYASEESWNPNLEAFFLAVFIPVLKPRILAQSRNRVSF